MKQVSDKIRGRAAAPRSTPAGDRATRTPGGTGEMIIQLRGALLGACVMAAGLGAVEVLAAPAPSPSQVQSLQQRDYQTDKDAVF